MFLNLCKCKPSLNMKIHKKFIKQNRFNSFWNLLNSNLDKKNKTKTENLIKQLIKFLQAILVFTSSDV